MNQIQDNTPEDKPKSIEEIMAENNLTIMNSMLSFINSNANFTTATTSNPNEKQNPKERLN
jgi:hypothetical protein